MLQNDLPNKNRLGRGNSTTVGVPLFKTLPMVAGVILCQICAFITGNGDVFSSVSVHSDFQRSTAAMIERE